MDDTRDDDATPDPDRFRRLPEPVRLGQTVAVHDVSPLAIAGIAGAGVLWAPDGGCGGD